MQQPLDSVDRLGQGLEFGYEAVEVERHELLGGGGGGRRGGEGCGGAGEARVFRGLY